MKNKSLKKLLVLLIIFTILSTSCAKLQPVQTRDTAYREKGVTIEDKGNYFNVILDYTTGLTNQEMGAAYAKGILEMLPEYEKIMDSYIAQNIVEYEYMYGINRAYDVKSQIPQAYYDEITGMASVFGNGENAWNDGNLTADEVLLFNLFPDVFRAAQCSYISVYGERAESGQTIVARNLDWFRGDTNQMAALQSVVTIKYDDVSVCNVGYLGYQGMLTGFSDKQIFAGILDSGSNEAYSSEGRRSYAMDLRYALEHFDKMEDAADYLGDPSMLYTFNHTIGFSDKTHSIILENNFSGDSSVKRGRLKREIRTEDSKLNDGIEWGIDNAVAAVNSFLLYGNMDNHTNHKYNTKRWKNIKEQLLAKGNTVSFEELKEITSYYGGKAPGVFSESGDIYNKMTVQMMVFIPETFQLEIYFPQRDTLTNPQEPIFKSIQVFE